MQHEASVTAVVIFALFVAATLGLSFWLGRRTKGAAGYFAAHGQIPWFVNGVAFAGDYLSAASFLGICGMIAFHGYDGFLYSIGFLAGWVVALFVIAEPMKRLGKFTFADAPGREVRLEGHQDRRGPVDAGGQRLLPHPRRWSGAGALVTPLLGLPHWAGVVMVGGVVIAIVTTAGMVSTTWVQFIKGGLLVVFSTILVGCVLWRGLEVKDRTGEALPDISTSAESSQVVEDFAAGLPDGYRPIGETGSEDGAVFVATDPSTGAVAVYELGFSSTWFLRHIPSTVQLSDGRTSAGGQAPGDFDRLVEWPMGRVSTAWPTNDDFNARTDAGSPATGPIGPVTYLQAFGSTNIQVPRSVPVKSEDGGRGEAFVEDVTSGFALLTPGNHPKFAGVKSDDPLGKINFLSLMLALFCGTASLPHILIRYYTVKDAAAARKSTIVGIATIGFFYVLTLFIGLGAMTSGALDPTDSNLAAPLLARTFGEWLFACISAVAFTTVLGTVSGLILASAGAVSHDLMTHGLGVEMDEDRQVRVAKLASVVVGVVAIGLGILFQGLNVGYLVGWAFSVAASANLPALVCILFWRGTTARGVVAGVTVGMVSSLAWILLSSDTFESVYGLDPAAAWTPFSQPGIVTIPLGFAALVGVSLLTRRRAS